MKFQINKGAMFGLDARIALAIFGALSVISGAALYSAIKTAKSETYRQYFEEMTKASEQYYLDNGKPLPQHTDSITVYVSDLVNNREGLSTWNGPYVTGSTTGTYYINDSTVDSADPLAHTILHLYKKSDWADTTIHQTCTIGNADCAEFLGFYVSNTTAEVKLQKVFDNLDDLVDGGDGCGTGNVRCLDFAPAGQYAVLYQGILRKREI